MSRTYPALDLIWTIRPDDDRLDRLIAEVDDDSPTAVEERSDRLRIFFPSPLARGRAAVRLVALEADLFCEPVEVPDEDWAERSQASLGAVRVGRLAVAPPWALAEVEPSDVLVTIQPSTGFGTGHHASTRLCLQLLQTEPVGGLAVLDIGTGSGVLAIAAARLGAAQVMAIDDDPDAMRSAGENVEANQVDDVVRLDCRDLVALGPAAFDLVVANLTGAVLMRHASRLAALVTPAGSLIASGYQSEEDDDVAAALGGAGLVRRERAEDDGWVAGRFGRGGGDASHGATVG